MHFVALQIASEDDGVWLHFKEVFVMQHKRIGEEGQWVKLCVVICGYVVSLYEVVL